MFSVRVYNLYFCATILRSIYSVYACKPRNNHPGTVLTVRLLWCSGHTLYFSITGPKNIHHKYPEITQNMMCPVQVN